MSPYRLAGLAGLVSALILVVNDLRRAGLLPADAVTHGIAPLSLLLAGFALTGLYLWQRAESGTLGLVGYALNAGGLVGAFGIEFTLNYVFPYLDTHTVDSLVGGPTGAVFRIVSVVFLAGALTFGVASWRAGRLPVPGLVLYMIGMVAVALRTVLPGGVAFAGLLIAAAGVAWLSLALWGPRVSAARGSR